MYNDLNAKIRDIQMSGVLSVNIKHVLSRFLDLELSVSEIQDMTLKAVKILLIDAAIKFGSPDNLHELSERLSSQEVMALMNVVIAAPALALGINMGRSETTEEKDREYHNQWVAPSTEVDPEKDFKMEQWVYDKVKAIPSFEIIVQQFRTNKDIADDVILTRVLIRHCILREISTALAKETHPLRLMQMERIHFDHDRVISEIGERKPGPEVAIDLAMIKALDIDMGFSLEPVKMPGTDMITIGVTMDKDPTNEISNNTPYVTFPKEHIMHAIVDQNIKSYYMGVNAAKEIECGCHSCKQAYEGITQQLTLQKDLIGDRIREFTQCSCSLCVQFSSKQPVQMHENAAKEITDNLFDRLRNKK